jgi:hypothetical protein
VLVEDKVYGEYIRPESALFDTIEGSERHPRKRRDAEVRDQSARVYSTCCIEKRPKP